MKFNLHDILAKLNSPKAYSAYAMVGVLATTSMAILNTRVHCRKNPPDKISEKELTREEAIEEVKDALITYIPTMICAGLTIGCIHKADMKWADYNSVINAAYIASRDKMARYRMLAPAAVGTELIQGLNGQKSEPDVEWYCIKDFPVNFGNEYDDFDRPIFETKDIYFQSTKADVIEAEYHLNRNFMLRQMASTREFFAFLGITDMHPEVFGDTLGWDVYTFLDDGMEPWIDFEHWHTIDESTGEVINMISFTWEPWFSEDGSPMSYGYGEGSGMTHSFPFSLNPKE